MNLSQAEVCRRMVARTGRNYLQQTLARIESGDQAPQLGEAEELAEIVGTNLLVMLRPAGLAREAWRLTTDARKIREAQADIRDARERMESACKSAEHFIAKAEEQGYAERVSEEISTARAALKAARETE